jgi:hypothetical protein
MAAQKSRIAGRSIGPMTATEAGRSKKRKDGDRQFAWIAGFGISGAIEPFFYTERSHVQAIGTPTRIGQVRCFIIGSVTDFPVFSARPLLHRRTPLLSPTPLTRFVDPSLMRFFFKFGALEVWEEEPISSDLYHRPAPLCFRLAIPVQNHHRSAFKTCHLTRVLFCSQMLRRLGHRDIINPLWLSKFRPELRFQWLFG